MKTIEMSEEKIKLYARLSDLQGDMATGIANEDTLKAAIKCASDLGEEWRISGLEAVYKTGQQLNRISGRFDKIEKYL